MICNKRAACGVRRMTQPEGLVVGERVQQGPLGVSGVQVRSPWPVSEATSLIPPRGYHRRLGYHARLHHRSIRYAKEPSTVPTATARSEASCRHVGWPLQVYERAQFTTWPVTDRNLRLDTKERVLWFKTRPEKRLQEKQSVVAHRIVDVQKVDTLASHLRSSTWREKPGR